MKQKTSKIHFIVIAALFLCIAANIAGTVYAEAQASVQPAVSIAQ